MECLRRNGVNIEEICEILFCAYINKCPKYKFGANLLKISFCFDARGL